MNIFDNPNNNDSYQILTRELIRYDFADELAFAFNPKAFIQDIPNSKGTAGSNKILKTIRDTYYAVEPYKHSDGESYEKYFRSLLFEYLEKVRDENASVKENVKALIETFLYIGEFLLVADLIESEYKVFAHEAETCNNVLDKPNRIYVHAYDFSELYGQAGDYLLFLKGDTQLALRFYKLAGLQWVAKIDSPLNDILSDAYYEAVKKAKKWIMVYEKFEALSKPNTTEMNWLGDNIYRVLYNLYYEAKKLSISDVWKNAEMFYNSVPFADDANKNLSTYERKNQIDILRVPIYMANIYRQENLKKVACYVASEIKKGKLPQDIYSNALYRVAEKTEETVFTYIDNSDKDARDKRNLLVSSLAMIYYVERIKEELTVKKFDKEYAYYTSLNTFNYMLPSEDKEDDAPGLLSIMHMSYMNDPNEGKILPSLIGLDTSIPYRKDATIPFVFLKCFTPRIDFLPMWKIYGDDAKGVCLVVDTEESFHKHSTPIYQICYVKKEKNKLQIQAKENASISPKSVKEIKEQIAIIGSLCKEIGIEWLINYLVSGIKYLFKDASYSYEEEVRILQVVSDGTSELIKKTPPIKDTNGDDILLSNKLYVATDAPICFEEVILGPKFENKSDRIPYLQRKIELMCKKNCIKKPRITDSSVIYR